MSATSDAAPLILASLASWPSRRCGWRQGFSWQRSGSGGKRAVAALIWLGEHAAAAVPSVIGVPGLDFTRAAFSWPSSLSGAHTPSEAARASDRLRSELVEDALQDEVAGRDRDDNCNHAIGECKQPVLFPPPAPLLLQARSIMTRKDDFCRGRQ